MAASAMAQLQPQIPPAGPAAPTGKTVVFVASDFRNGGVMGVYRGLEEASRISGASPLLTVGKITLPMMTPSLIAGALLVFVSAASCYGIPSIIGA